MRASHTTLSLGLVFSLFTIAGPVDAKTLKVPERHATIQEAIDASSAGDVIEIGKGIYRERLTVPADRTGLTLRGSGQAIVDAYPDGFSAGPGIEVFADRFVIENLVVRHARSRSGSSGTGLLVRGDRARIRRVTASGNQWGGISVIGSNARISHCRTSGNVLDGHNEWGIRTSGDDNRIEHCRSVGDHDGFYLTGDAPRIRNCVAEGSTGRGITVDCRGGEGLIRDCTVKGSVEQALYAQGKPCRIQGNLLEGGQIHGATLWSASLFIDNRVRNFMGRYAGLHIRTSGVTASGNHFANLRGGAINVSDRDAVIENNRIEGCGSHRDEDQIPAVGLSSSGSRVADNRIKACPGVAVQVYGSLHEVRNNRIQMNLREGILVSAGTSNVLVDNIVRRNGGEGIENHGTDTIATGNRISGNRLDLASIQPFALFSANQYQTGGPDIPPEFN